MKTARVEAGAPWSTFTFAAVEARTLTGDMVAMEASDVGEGKLGFTLRVPIGVVGAISPFNFPLNLVAHKVAPAIAAGCPVVLKPASQTPLSAIALATLLLDECGLPPGWLNVVTGGGGTVGNALVDSDVAMITFTGSPDVGWGIKARAPHKKVGLELGNNAPVIIEPDGDWRPPRRRSRWPASATPGSRASRPSGSTRTSRSPTTSSPAGRPRRGAERRRSAARGHGRLGPDLARRARPGRRAGSRKPSGVEPRSPPAARPRRRPEPTVLTERRAGT